jgi:hypothetical protein
VNKSKDTKKNNLDCCLNNPTVLHSFDNYQIGRVKIEDEFDGISILMPTYQHVTTCKVPFASDELTNFDDLPK